jgi:hypothetical protein
MPEETWEDNDDVWRSLLEPVNRMGRDLRAAAATLSDEEAKYLCDSYYTMQEDRKRAGGQQRALDKSGEPHQVINWLFAQSGTLEKQIKGALDVYTEHHIMGSYMRATYGIGPVLSAGLLAHIHMGDWCHVCHAHSEKACEQRQKDKKAAVHHWQPVFSCPTVGHIWAFMGWAADGQKPWDKSTKRPFNAKLKVIGWKIGQSFMKFSGDERCYYGRVYKERKAYEVERNDRGALAEQAAKGAERVRKTTDAWPWYAGCYPAGTLAKYLATPEKGRPGLLASLKGEPGSGTPMLPPGHIDARARRYAVKLFIAHLFEAWYERATGKPPPLPYPVAFLNHAHITPPPNETLGTRPPRAEAAE